MSRFTISEAGVITVYPSKKKVALILAGALAFVAFGVSQFIVNGGLLLPRFTLAVVCLVGVPFFGMCAVYAVRRLRNDVPSIVIDHEGILDNGSALAAGRIWWHEINDLRAYSFSGHMMLGIGLDDVDAVIARQKPWKRLFLRANNRMAGYPINISQTMLPIPIERLLNHIHEQFEV